MMETRSLKTATNCRGLVENTATNCRGFVESGAPENPVRSKPQWLGFSAREMPRRGGSAASFRIEPAPLCTGKNPVIDFARMRSCRPYCMTYT